MWFINIILPKLTRDYLKLGDGPCTLHPASWLKNSLTDFDTSTGEGDKQLWVRNQASYR